MTGGKSSFMQQIAAAKKDAAELRKVMGESARTAARTFQPSREEAPPASAQKKDARCEPRHLLGYGDCKCVLSKYCDGTCNPIYEDRASAAPTAASSPATVAQPVELPVSKEFCVQHPGTAAYIIFELAKRIDAADAAQPCPSQGCGGAGSGALTDEQLDAAHKRFQDYMKWSKEDDRHRIEHNHDYYEREAVRAALKGTTPGGEGAE